MRKKMDVLDEHHLSVVTIINLEPFQLNRVRKCNEDTQRQDFIGLAWDEGGGRVVVQEGLAGRPRGGMVPPTTGRSLNKKIYI